MKWPKRLAAIFSAILCLATIFMWIRGYYARDGIWYSTDSMRYSIHSYRGRIWLWKLSIAPNPAAMVWGTPLRMSTGVQVDSVKDSWYAPYLGKVKSISLERDFIDAPSQAWGSSAVDRNWLGFRYVHTDGWFPRAQLMQGYPSARSRAVFVPHWAIVLLTAILPAIASLRLVQNRNRRHHNLCPKCGYDLRATPGRCPECGYGTSPAQ
jgi:hypothetical protein